MFKIEEVGKNLRSFYAPKFSRSGYYKIKEERVNHTFNTTQ